jgi:glycine dehydrogenase subunit 1
MISRYIPNISHKSELLVELGVKQIAELFSDIPEEVKIKGLNLPRGKSEYEVEREVRTILKLNKPVGHGVLSFLGGGVYHHFTPAIVRAIVKRAELYTSYTPYQPELSQGLLQILFEFQSMLVELTGMDVANTSMYDGATALGEAALMACRVTHRKKFLVPEALHWEKRSVLKNYVKYGGVKLETVPYEKKTGKLDLNRLEALITPDTAGVYVETPNFFGVYETELDAVREIAKKALLVVGVNPLALAVIKPPGDYGADIVVGELQPFGVPMCFGGPHIGMFACKSEYVRNMPGRLIGVTLDSNGRRVYCMTLQTREQHIRRERATSNICTNHTLCAVAVAVYLAAMGWSGLIKVARRNIENAYYLARKINKIEGYEAPIFKSAHFNEFVLRAHAKLDKLLQGLLALGIEGGIRLDLHFPKLGNALLLATTETHTLEDLDKFLAALKLLSEAQNAY